MEPHLHPGIDIILFVYTSRRAVAKHHHCSKHSESQALCSTSLVLDETLNQSLSLFDLVNS